MACTAPGLAGGQNLGLRLSRDPEPGPPAALQIRWNEWTPFPSPTAEELPAGQILALALGNGLCYTAKLDPV